MGRKADRALTYRCSACSELFEFEPESEAEAADGPQCPVCGDRNVRPLD